MGKNYRNGVIPGDGTGPEVVAEGLKACGVNLEMGEDWLKIHGNGKVPHGGVRVKTELDQWWWGGLSLHPQRIYCWSCRVVS